MAGGNALLRRTATALLLPVITACSAAADGSPPPGPVGEEAALEQADAMLESPGPSAPRPAPGGTQSVQDDP